MNKLDIREIPFSALPFQNLVSLHLDLEILDDKPATLYLRWSGPKTPLF